MAALPIDLSAGLVPSPTQKPAAVGIDLSAGLIPRQVAQPQSMRVAVPQGNTIQAVPGSEHDSDLLPTGLSPSTPLQNLEGNFARLGRGIQGVIRNSPIGYTAESMFPKLADALNLHPTQTPSSPGYSSDPTQRPMLPLQYLMPGNPQTKTGNLLKGVLRGTGQLTTPNNVATATAIAATGGTVAPLLPAAGIAGTLARLGTQGVNLGMAGVGAKGIYNDAGNAYQQYNAGDTNGAMDSLGAALPNAALTLPALGEPIAATGRAMQRGGVGLINETISAGKAQYRRGANPGEGYFQAGFGPSASIQSIADKSQNALGLTGQAIGATSQAAQDAGTLIPFDSGAAAITRPIARTRAALTGPGGTGNSGAVDSYESTYTPMLQAAEQRGGFLPTEYAAAKRNAAANTTWTDPTQAGMRDLRQMTVGGMGGELVNAIPELAPLNSKYQNLTSLTNRASDLAQSSGGTLPGLVRKLTMGGIATGSGAVTHNPYIAAGVGALGAAMDSVPARTALASGAYFGGKGLEWAGNRLANPFGLFDAASLPDGSANDHPNGNADQNQNGNQNQWVPPSAPYRLQNLPPEIIRPDALSRSQIGVGGDGRAGTLIRPLGLLPAPPAPLKPLLQATPLTLNRLPVQAAPGTTAERLAPSIGSRSSLIPNRLLGTVTSEGSPEAQAAALRKAQLGSYGHLVPERGFSPSDGTYLLSPSYRQSLAKRLTGKK